MDDFDEKADRIRELAGNPDVLFDHLDSSTQPLHEAAPNITQSLNTSIANGVQFLNSKLPKSGSSYLLDEKPKISDGQKHAFNQYYSAVNDPISLLDHVNEGTLTANHMEAVKAVHPELLQEMQSKVLQKMDPEKSKKLSYPKKLSLSKFLGQPLDQSMSPNAILSNQAIFASPSLSNQSTPKGGMRVSQGGMKEMKIAQRQNTRTEDDEEN